MTSTGRLTAGALPLKKLMKLARALLLSSNLKRRRSCVTAPFVAALLIEAYTLPGSLIVYSVPAGAGMKGPTSILAGSRLEIRRLQTGRGSEEALTNINVETLERDEGIAAAGDGLPSQFEDGPVITALSGRAPVLKDRMARYCFLVASSPRLKVVLTASIVPPRLVFSPVSRIQPSEAATDG